VLQNVNTAWGAGGGGGDRLELVSGQRTIVQGIRGLQLECINPRLIKGIMLELFGGRSSFRGKYQRQKRGLWVPVVNKAKRETEIREIPPRYRPVNIRGERGTLHRKGMGKEWGGENRCGGKGVFISESG